MTPVDDALTPSTVIPYLQASGLLAAHSPGRLAVTQRPTLNLNFAVRLLPRDRRSTAAGWFVKQGLGLAGRRAIAREQAAYRVLHRQPDRVGNFVPTVVHYDWQRAVLVLQLANVAENLHERRRTDDSFSARLGMVLGEALGCLHEREAPVLGASYHSLGPELPWLLRAHRPRPAFLRSASPADLEIVKLLQQSGPIREGLDALAAGWQPQVFVHGDFRWENCVVSRLGSTKPVAWLVDFERACGGDPALDVGAALAEYFRCWLASMPSDARLTSSHLSATAGRPLEKMRSEVAAFWDAYASARGSAGAERAALLARSMNFAAVRLIGAAFELTEQAEHLSALAGRAVQVAENLFVWPWQASAQQIGIAP